MAYERGRAVCVFQGRWRTEMIDLISSGDLMRLFLE